MCSRSEDGSIRVWSTATGKHERTLQADDDDDAKPTVYALAVWQGRLIGGHGGGGLRVWNVAEGECCPVLEGHPRAVLASGEQLR